MRYYNMEYWKRLTHRQQDTRITAALKKNIDYTEKTCLGIPASKLDPYVFTERVSFLKSAPLLRTYVQNPNHIGCHTCGESEKFFAGTQQLEREVIELLSVDLFRAEKDSCDGYVAAGGTEANIQAAWIYRNYFIKERRALHEEIALLTSTDTHYSVDKAANLLNISKYTVAVDEATRTIDSGALADTIGLAKIQGIRYLIVFCNMGTTMFGSIDDPDTYIRALEAVSIEYKIHVDAAFGGFVYPFSDPNKINFSNPAISSVTLDAHKMLQAPYGTGILLIRKGFMQYTRTKEAGYVSGLDTTLSGSRGGVNAIAIWMILFTYGPLGWVRKVNKLLQRTNWLCEKLNALNIQYYRHPNMNIVAIKAVFILPILADRYGLVPDNHTNPKWYKIVLMEHVTINDLQRFVADLLT
jgi:tyrosine decarboxylase/aspartate 1-decarboxylase